MAWTLERINSREKTFINLKGNARSFLCGRAYGNDILCRNMLVSRKHCVFVGIGNGWQVRDLGSGNGTFINGKVIRPNVCVDLKENDIIGIGHSSLDDRISSTFADNAPYTFRLQKGNVTVLNLATEVDEELTQVSRPLPTGTNKEAPKQDENAKKRPSTAEEAPDCTAKKVSKPNNDTIYISDSDSDIFIADENPVPNSEQVEPKKEPPDEFVERTSKNECTLKNERTSKNRGPGITPLLPSATVDPIEPRPSVSVKEFARNGNFNPSVEIDTAEDVNILEISPRSRIEKSRDNTVTSSKFAVNDDSVADKSVKNILGRKSCSNVSSSSAVRPIISDATQHKSPCPLGPRKSYGDVRSSTSVLSTRHELSCNNSLSSLSKKESTDVISLVKSPKSNNRNLPVTVTSSSLVRPVNKDGKCDGLSTSNAANGFSNGVRLERTSPERDALFSSKRESSDDPAISSSIIDSIRGTKAGPIAETTPKFPRTETPSCSRSNPNRASMPLPDRTFHPRLRIRSDVQIPARERTELLDPLNNEYSSHNENTRKNRMEERTDTSKSSTEFSNLTFRLKTSAYEDAQGRKSAITTSDETGQKRRLDTDAETTNSRQDVSVNLTRYENVEGNATRLTETFKVPSVQRSAHYSPKSPRLTSVAECTNKSTNSTTTKTEIKTEPSNSYSTDDIEVLSDNDFDFFPSSQLFDSKDDIVFLPIDDQIDVKVKSENENVYTSREEDFDDVIVLSDSEDEAENPWLAKLSLSQHMKTEPPDEPSSSARTAQLGLDDIDLKFPIKSDEVDLPEDKIVEEQNPPIVRVAIPYLRDNVLPFKIEENNTSEYSPTQDDNRVTSIALTADRSMTFDSDSRPQTRITSQYFVDQHEESTCHSNSVGTLEAPINAEGRNYPDAPIATRKVHVNTETSRSRENDTGPKESVSSEPRQIHPEIENEQGSNLRAPSKGPVVIEPLKLKVRNNQNTRSMLTAGGMDEEEIPAATSNKVHLLQKECKVMLSKLPKSFHKQETEKERMAKILERENERSRKKRLNPWLTSKQASLASRNVNSPLIKKGKSQLKQERKEKLKALTERAKADLVVPTVKRVTAKPKVKTSARSRGDFLIEKETDIIRPGTSSRSSPHSGVASTSRGHESLDAVSTGVANKAASPGRKTKTSQRSGSAEAALRGSASIKTLGKSNRDKVTIPKLKVTKSKPTDTEIVRSPLAYLEETSASPHRRKSALKPTPGSSQSSRSTKKRVAFATQMTAVREYEIDPGNCLNKCRGKDMPMPRQKMICVANSSEKCRKLEEFLIDVFMWSPKWLEEQQHCKTEPPVIGENTLIPLLFTYKSYEDYYRIHKPLLLLELWHAISKDYFTASAKRHPTLFGSVESGSITSTGVESTNASLSTMKIQVLVTDKDLMTKNHPLFGDLLFLELCYRSPDNKSEFLCIFAYVTNMQRTKLTPSTFFNRDLLNHTRNPSSILTYTVITRHLKVNVATERIMRLKCVTYLRPNMRMVQAIQYLPRSPLAQFIIEPKIQDYQLPDATEDLRLVTGDKLNQKQLEAVLKTTQAVVEPTPKICLIQGPPGTGKSTVIINMIMQILYGNNRYKNKRCRNRILMCAPSNAAIDEIVLRLMDIRQKLPNDRFRLVRVGRCGTMHPRVQDLSLEMLASRDVKRLTGQTTATSMSSVENEKRILESMIREMQEELNVAMRCNLNHDYLKLKLANTKSKYDLLSLCNSATSNPTNVVPQECMKQLRDAEMAILAGADIVACTLSTCYTNMMEAVFGGGKNGLSVCIVDEATQSCEAETLIPLLLGVKNLVLVGDPNQLSAMVVSQEAKKWGLEQSLFLRIQRVFERNPNDPVIMLDTQYRMDQHICHWPNNFFYSGKLRAGICRQYVLPFRPYRVFNLNSVQNIDKFTNTNEAEFVSNLIRALATHLDANNMFNPVSIAIITPYQNQKVILQSKIKEKLTRFMERSRTKITTEVNTVDSFQGQERDIVVMSCVRSSGIGFLSDPQRLCVALTRAKYTLILCGNFATFQRDVTWKSLLADAKNRQVYVNISADASSEAILSNITR